MFFLAMIIGEVSLWLMDPFYAILAPIVALYLCLTETSARVKTGTKTSGYEYEQYVASRLKSIGYTDVTMTPKSGDYGADIIAFDTNGKRVAVQCKRYSKPVGVKAVQEVLAAVSYYKCSYGVVICTSSFTKSAQELAIKSGVQLRIMN